MAQETLQKWGQIKYVIRIFDLTPFLRYIILDYHCAGGQIQDLLETKAQHEKAKTDRHLGL